MNGGLLALGCIGAAQLLAQTALLRLLLSFTGGNELVIGWALAVWLVGGALGARAARGWRSGFWAIAALYAIVLLLTARAVPALFPPEPGAFVIEHPLRLLANCCALLPVSFLGGMLFPLGLRLAGGSLPRRYAADVLGAAAGGLLTLWLLAGLGSGGQLTGSLVLWALLCCGLAIVLRRYPLLAVPLPFLGLIAYLALWPGFIVMFTDPELGLETANGIFITRNRDGQTSFYGNRQLLGLWPATSADRELALLPPAFAVAPRQQLQLGGCFSPLADASRRFSDLQNTLVDLDVRTAKFFLHNFARGDTDLDDRTNALAEDPRQYLTAAPPADIITIAGGIPDNIAGNRLFTTEFFTLARQHLTPGGVLAFALPVSENYLAPLQAQLVAAEVTSLRDAGFTVGLYPMTRLLVVAMPAAALPDSAAVLARLQVAGISDPEVVSNFTFAAHPLRQQMLQQALAGAPAIPNTDARPLSGLLTLASWLALFADDSNLTLPARSAMTASAAVFVILLLVGGVIFHARRRAPQRAVTMALVAAGAAAMTSHLLLLTAYQTRCGTLFHELGMLNAAFMLGGALAARVRLPVRLLPFGAALAAGGAPLLLTLPNPGLALACLLITFNGWAGGGLFLTLAARLPDGSSRGYAADLAGAAPAALLVLPLAVPLLSLPGTALAAALLVAWSAVALTRA